MKSSRIVAYALALLFNAAFLARFAAPVAGVAPSASPPPSFAEQFYRDHPELRDEGEVVDAASRILAAEGHGGNSEALAARSHEIIAERTPEEWQRKAIQLFPALGVAGSEFNALFLKHYNELKRSDPSFASEPSWPILLAKRCADELRANKPVASQTTIQVQRNPPVTAAKESQKPAKQDASLRRGHPWQTAFCVVLLLVVTVAPALFVLRRVNAHVASSCPSSKGTVKLWWTALKHATILYMLIAFPTAIHTLAVNSDLGCLDRLAISAAVGALFGVFVALPLGVLDALWQSLRRQGIRSVAHR